MSVRLCNDHEIESPTKDSCCIWFCQITGHRGKEALVKILETVDDLLLPDDCANCLREFK